MDHAAYKAFFELDNRALIITDDVDSIQDTNLHASRIFGRSHAQLKEMKLKELIPTEKINSSGEFEFLMPDRELRMFSITKYPHFHLELNLSIISEVIESTKNKTQFLDIAAHELRNQITAISLLLQIAQNQINKGIPLLPSTIKRLKAPSDRLNRLVTDLLDLSRLERRHVVLNKSEHSIQELIIKCVEEFQIQAPDRVFIFDRLLNSIQIQMDALRLQQVLSNLIENALKYTPLNTPIEITIEKLSNTIRVSVKDQGPGIKPEKIKNIFKPFSRDLSDTETHSSGLGLGLSICQEIIELHHGKIGVTSNRPKGSIFYFELPMS